MTIITGRYKVIYFLGMFLICIHVIVYRGYPECHMYVFSRIVVCS